MLTHGDELGISENGHRDTLNQTRAYATMVPAQPKLCKNKGGFVQYMHTLLKLCALVGAVVATLHNGLCLIWIDENAEESVSTIEEEA